MLQILALSALLQAATVSQAVGPADTSLAASRDSFPGSTVSFALAQPESADSALQRPHAVVLSDWYYRRLLIHRIGSYAELPLFAGEYLLGHTLLTSPGAVSSWVRPTHLVTAEGLGVLFTTNTITGVWNLIDAWPPPSQHRTLLLTHTALMLAADAGFVITGRLGRQTATRNFSTGTEHEHAALISIGTATVGTAIMWLWNR